jgi:predicted metal-dependent hydrolase
VRVSDRTRRLTVRVYPGGRVEVTVPPRTRPGTVEHFVRAHREWIDAKVLEFASLRRRRDPTLPTEVRMSAVGQSWGIRYLERARPGWKVVADGAVEVYGALATPEKLRVSLRAWLTETARKALEPRIFALAAERGFTIERVQMRRQHTRWGSCSRGGTVSLNVCLVFQSPAVVRYLMLHELCHTRHMNHSDRFWALVESEEPNYRALDAELTSGWQFVPDWVYG